jgi:ADP-heptose:LPS heptosyltransferase
LIYRLGSLGDTVVALPCFHLIERAFPNSLRRVLTNLPVHAKAPAMSEVLRNSGLANSWLGYPVASRTLRELLPVIRAVREWKSELLVYLAEPRGRWSVYRDLCFFRLCGVRRIIGAPLSDALRENQPVTGAGYCEYEAQRLARCLAELGEPHLDDPESWDLRLNDAERQKAKDILSLPEVRRRRFLACSVGTKVEVKNWGEARWSLLSAKLSHEFPGLGLVLVGSAEEAAVIERVGMRWRGPMLNLCGMLTPRETAAVLELAAGFVGHDSGPMHLAAAVGTPCTAVFSARNIPRVWFPYGEHHRVIYHHTPCAGCQLDQCVIFGKQCIESIAVDEVYTQAAEMLVTEFNSARESSLR